MKRIAILGSTGSIGRNTLDVVRCNLKRFKITAISANSNIDALYAQIKEFHPLSVCVKEEDKASSLKKRLDFKVKVFSGDDGLLNMLEDKHIDMVVLALSGAGALFPLLKAVESGKTIALANKEALVMAGEIIMDKANRQKVKIVPVDSEQSAIWQCLEGEEKAKLKNIYLTASGGPFRKLHKRRFKNITVKEALRHPRWKMGQKISVDSATLMNKGLEILEAMYLFGVGPKKIKIIVHPEAIIHSMVEFIDGVVIAQLAVSDMCIPIQYALSYPQRFSSNGFGSLDFFKLKQLNFEPPDLEKFPCLQLAYNAAKAKGTTPCVLNAANEISVNEFLNEKLSFVGIPKVIEKVLAKHKNIQNPGLNDILEADRWAREEAYRVINSKIRYENSKLLNPNCALDHGEYD